MTTCAHLKGNVRGYDNIDCEYDHSRNGDDYDDYYDGGSDDGDVGDSSNDDNDEDGEVWRSRFNAQMQSYIHVGAATCQSNASPCHQRDDGHANHDDDDDDDFCML